MPADFFPLPVTVLLLVLSVSLTRAATKLVMSLADSGPNSLRQTIAAAAWGDTITFAVSGTITLTSGQLVLNKDLILQGPGSDVLAISANEASRVIKVDAGVTALISALTLRNGHAPNGDNGTVIDFNATPGGPGEAGGAIHTGGTLTLLDCRISSSAAGNGGPGAEQFPSASAGGNGGAGGGIYSTGTLTLSNCVVEGNVAGTGGQSGATTYSLTSGSGGPGGGIYSTGILRLDQTTVSGNATGKGGDTPRESRGADGGSGGGVWSSGSLVANNSTFAGNMTRDGGSGGADSLDAGTGGSGGDGGGICGTGPLALTNCTIRNNACGKGGNGGFGQFDGGAGGNGGSGGGIRAASSLAMVSCTVNNNTTGPGGTGGNAFYYYAGNGGRGGTGGGIQAEGSFTILNCTVNNNAGGTGGFGGQYGSYITEPPLDARGPGGFGGGIFIRTVATNVLGIANCTVVSNGAGSGWGDLARGGGLCNESGAVVGCVNTLVALNTGTSPDVFGAFASLGHNLIGATNDSTGFVSAGDRVGSLTAPLAPQIGPPGNNGGPTLTMALLPGSPALEAGTAAGAPATDQRGVARPQGCAVDIGAFEFRYTRPVISAANWATPTTFQLQMCGLPDQQYTLQCSTNLVNWTALDTVTSDSHGAIHCTDSRPPGDRLRAYRLKHSAD